MRRTAVTAPIAALASGIAFSVPAAADQAMIEEAMSAAPPQISETATIKTMQGETLREGGGAYTCFPGVPEGPGPMCVDEEWARLVEALMNKQDYQPSQIGLAYMLAGDMPGGGASNIDPFATGPTDDNQWVVEGPHIMVIVPDEAALEALPTDPDNGGPYVMWKGTPFAHIMVPTAER